MIDECTCTEVDDCARCVALEKKGDDWLKYNDAMQVGRLLEERDQLREAVLAIQGALCKLDKASR